MTGGELAFLVFSIATFTLFAAVLAWADKRTRSR